MYYSLVLYLGKLGVLGGCRERGKICKNFYLIAPVARNFSMKEISLIPHHVLGTMRGTSHVLSYIIFIANTGIGL